MNARERFVEVMKNFNTGVPSLKWEFGYWGGTLNSWYKSGLNEVKKAPIPHTYTSASSSIYTKSWICDNKFVKPGEYPEGFVAMAGGLYWPTQGFALDHDVKHRFGMDETQQLVDLNLMFYPTFEPETLEEDDTSLKYRDLDGVVRLFLKESATMATGWVYPIRDWETWNTLKAERMSLDNVRQRLPADWDQKVKEYKNRTYPLAVGGYPLGFFGTLAHLIGYDNLFYMYYDEPELVHDILATFTDMWIAVFSEVLVEVEIDHVQIWEDISFGKGSMLSEAMMREFLLPYYKKMTSFFRGCGVDLIFVDTDGYCMDIIPFFIEAGATGMYPFETDCGMDIVKVRKAFPELAIMGGISKSSLGLGHDKIDEILLPVKEVLKTGGYIPFCDHFVPPDVKFEDFAYYRDSLNNMIDRVGR